MGRRKLQIKRIEDNNARQMSFTKRRNGLLKKAEELSILCGVDVAAIIFSSKGKLYDYSSNHNLTRILQRYRSHVGIEEGSSNGVCITQEQYPKYADALASGELLQFVERELGEPCIDQLSVTDLVHLEKQLQDALILTRSTEEKILAEEKMHLEEKVAQSERTNKLIMDLNVMADSQTKEQ